MFLELITTLLWAQSELFTPELYLEQTKLCHFEKTQELNVSAETVTPQDLLLVQKKYALSPPLIDQDSFLDKLAEVLYKNEADCKMQNLTHWNKNEDFPSLGLPHAIWYGPGQTHRFQEQFPELIHFIRKNLKHFEKTKITWPTLLRQENIGAAPWKNFEHFQKIQATSLEIEASQDSGQLSDIQKRKYPFYTEAYYLFELRHFLANPIVLRLQARYVIEKTFLSLHQILAQIEKRSPEQAQKTYDLLQTLLQNRVGFLSVVDYLNFKGLGLTPKERTPLENHSWGLATVLSLYPHVRIQKKDCAKTDKSCLNERFVKSALCALQRSAHFAGPPGSREQTQRYKWLNGGWKTRIENNYRADTFDNDRCEKFKKSLTSEKK